MKTCHSASLCDELEVTPHSAGTGVCSAELKRFLNLLTSLYVFIWLSLLIHGLLDQFFKALIHNSFLAAFTAILKNNNINNHTAF